MPMNLHNTSTADCSAAIAAHPRRNAGGPGGKRAVMAHVQAGKAMALPRCVAHDAGMADPAGQRRRTPVALPLIYDQPADLLF